jgi:alanyl-tRNA synthetase
MLRLLGAEKYKSMTRISFIAGRRVLRDSRALRENAGIVSRSLSVPVMETGNGVLAFIEKAHVLEQRYNDLAEAAAEIKAKALLDKNQKSAVLIECFENEDMEEVMRIGRAVQKLTDAILVLASMRELKFAAVCAAAGQDVRPIVKEAFQKAGGKGGGGANSFKGIFASEKDILAFISIVRANCSVQEQGPQAP